MNPIIVTAARTEESLSDIALPASVVLREVLAQQGALRLSDAFATIPGLTLFDDHGTGLQIQGFAPDYTLILFDGEPIIGRTAGTLDLDRVSVHGVSRIEVIHGPSSSLYGSDALAGVVNIITAPPEEGVRGMLSMRAGTFSTTDLAGKVEAARGGTGGRLLLNRYASAGYDLTPNSYGPSAPSFTNWMGDLRGRATLSDRTRIRLGARASVENQQGAFASTNSDDVEIRFDDNGEAIEWMLHPEAEFRLFDRYRLTTTLYAARYRTKVRHRRQSDRVLTYADDFDQRYAKAELQLDAFWSARHLTTIGAGAIHEALAGDRYGGDAPRSNLSYGFLQHQWIPTSLLKINASARFDTHSDYAARFTPRLAILVRPMEWLRFRASVGSGFKAPAFRQIYLSFTNPAAGYTVFGAARLAEGIERLQSEGQVDQLFLAPELLENIRAESSVAVNIGGSAEPYSWLAVTVNAFYNDVQDLIETQPVARKKNGQSVFGYFNIARIYTRGVDAQGTLFLNTGSSARLEFTAGYQYLQARDREVISNLKSGIVFGRDPNGRDYPLRVGDYGGLFGRSPHTATFRALWMHTASSLTASVRARWRSRYGYRDLDGNAVANRVDEFVAGYAVVDATITKTLSLRMLEAEAQLGIDNVFDTKEPLLIPALPGRKVFLSFRFLL